MCKFPARGNIGRISGTRMMKKLNESKMRWILRRKAEGTMTNRQIAHTMAISTIWVKKIWAEYRHAGKPSGLSFRSQMGRPPGSMHGRREQSTVICAYYGCLDAGSRWQTIRHNIEESTGMTMPYGTIRKVMRDEELSERQPNKSRRSQLVSKLI